MIHILQSVSNMDRGGIETVLMNVYRHLDRSCFQFDFLVNKPKPGLYDDEIRALGGRIWVSPGLSPAKYPAYMRFMAQLLKDQPQIQALHAHNEAMAYYALRGAQKANLPVRIAHAHNTHPPRDYKLPLNLACKALIPSAATDYWITGPAAGTRACTILGKSAGSVRALSCTTPWTCGVWGFRRTSGRRCGRNTVCRTGW